MILLNISILLDSLIVLKVFKISEPNGVSSNVLFN